jgi:Na+/glutamate symporter
LVTAPPQGVLRWPFYIHKAKEPESRYKREISDESSHQREKTKKKNKTKRKGKKKFSCTCVCVTAATFIKLTMAVTPR